MVFSGLPRSGMLDMRPALAPLCTSLTSEAFGFADEVSGNNAAVGNPAGDGMGNIAGDAEGLRNERTKNGIDESAFGATAGFNGGDASASVAVVDLARAECGRC